AIAQGCDLRGGEVARAVRVEDDHEVVAGAVTLREVHGTILRPRAEDGAGVRGAALLPEHVGVACEPGDLASGVAPRERLRLRDGLIRAHGALELSERLRVSDRARRGRSEAARRIADRAGLLDDPRAPHGLHPSVEASDELFPR